MRYPNLRYGNPNELNHYAQGMPLKDLARRLRRSERSVRDWLSGAKKVPWWIPEILRLQNVEHAQMLRQMGVQPVLKRLGLVTSTATLYSFPRIEPAEPVPHHDEHTLPLFAQA